MGNVAKEILNRGERPGQMYQGVLPLIVASGKGILPLIVASGKGILPQRCVFSGVGVKICVVFYPKGMKIGCLG